jgi:hypothetical protein
MKRRSKNVVASVLAAFFAFGILCSTFAAPGQALASVSGCSQTAGAMAMQGCDYATYLCGFDSNTTFLSQGALSSARPTDSLKKALGLALGALLIDVSTDLASPAAREWRNVFPTEPGKVSGHLFNSVLNL